MNDENNKKLHPETMAIRAGTQRTEFAEHSDALFLTSSFLFENAEDGALKFATQRPGYTYSRVGNPTVSAFEERMAILAGGERAVATSSGMAAIMSICMGHLKAGDHVVVSKSLFGATIQLFNNYIAKFGVEVSFAPLADVSAWAAAIQSNTKLLFLETPSNPLAEVADIAQLAQLAHQHGALLAIDDSFCTPILQQPLALGADLVAYSATKYLDGQGRVLGGVVVGAAALIEPVHAFMRTGGASLSPFNAWILLKGLETLPLRMKAHSDNALQLAQWLETRPEIAKVHYTWLDSHPQQALAKRQQKAGGGVVSFELKGGKDAAWHLIDHVELLSRTSNLGDVRSTITHPASTTHGRLAPEARAAAGIQDGLVRVAVGLEHIDDLIADIAQAL